DQVSVLTSANGFIMIDAVASADALDNYGLFMVAFRWNQDRHRFADDLFGEIAKEPLGTLVPAGNEAIEILADDCIIAGLDDGSEPPELLPAFAQRCFRLIALNEVRSLSGKHVQWPHLAICKTSRRPPIRCNHAQQAAGPRHKRRGLRSTNV